MAGAHPGARLGRGSEKAISRPRVDNLRGAASQRRAHGFEGSNDVSGSARGEPAWCTLDLAGFRSGSLNDLLPLVQIDANTTR